MEQAIKSNFNRMIYGYERNDAGQACINPEQSKIVKAIFKKYLEGYSLGSLSEWLTSTCTLSPTGKEKWGRATLDKLLSNQAMYRLLSAQINMRKLNWRRSGGVISKLMEQKNAENPFAIILPMF